MDTIDDQQTHIFVFPEELRETTDCEIELDSVHTRNDKQIGHHFHDEVVLVTCDLSLTGRITQDVLKIVFVIGMAHFLNKLSGTKLTLYINQNGLEFLTLCNLDWFSLVHGLLGCVRLGSSTLCVCKRLAIWTVLLV